MDDTEPAADRTINISTDLLVDKNLQINEQNNGPIIIVPRRRIISRVLEDNQDMSAPSPMKERNAANRNLSGRLLII